MSRFPSFNPDAEFTDGHWMRLRARLESGYRKVILKVAAQESRARGFVTKTQPNQFSGSMEEYLKRASGTRIKDIVDSERERVGAIVHDSINKVGRVGREDIAQIRDTVGLTKDQMDRINSLDISDKAKAARVRKAKKQRAQTISRTEANAVRNQGLLKSWSDAKEAGQIQGAAMKEWVAFPDERMSDICENLNGQRVRINHTFDGGFFAPPAHPNCRSTMVLVDA